MPLARTHLENSLKVANSSTRGAGLAEVPAPPAGDAQPAAPAISAITDMIKVVRFISGASGVDGSRGAVRSRLVTPVRPRIARERGWESPRRGRQRGAGHPEATPEPRPGRLMLRCQLSLSGENVLPSVV
ncbi:hypothetical protein GCM10009677_32700 [Sphaerisporangium rubeum]